MQKLAALGAARKALAEKRWGAARVSLVKYVSDQFVEWLCDYGESPSRVLLTLVAVYLLFTLTYVATGAVAHGTTPTRNPLDVASFSLSVMTTVGTLDGNLRPRDEWVSLLAGLQALLGIGLTGLLGFVLGNRIRR